MLKLGRIKVFLDKDSKIVFLAYVTYIHIDFGDVHRVMMAVLGRMQFAA